MNARRNKNEWFINNGCSNHGGAKLGGILNRISVENNAKLGNGDQFAGKEHEKDEKDADAIKNWDPHALQPHLGEKNISVPLQKSLGGGAPGAWGRWMNLFGVKPSGKSSFPKIIDKSDKEKGIFALEVPTEIIDHNILGMAATLVGKLIDPKPNIDLVRIFARNKWELKG